MTKKQDKQAKEPNLFNYEMTKDLPTTPLVKEIFSVLSGAVNGKEAMRRYKGNIYDVSHGKTKINTYMSKDGKRLHIEVENDISKSVIEIPSLLELSKHSFAATKLFLYIMNKGIEQHVITQTGKDIGVTFFLTDMVKDGLYADVKSARRAFKEGYDILKEFEATGRILLKSGTVEGRKDVTPDADKARYMFIGRDIEKAGSPLPCKVYFNPLMNWDFLLHFYTTVPIWTFSLPKRAMNLMFWIFANARKNVGSIRTEKPCYITASYKSIQAWLNLPRLDETDTPKKEIILPIHAAIQDIKDAHDDFKRDVMADVAKEKAQATTDEERKEAEAKEAYYTAMFDRPDFKITKEEPEGAKTKDILASGKITAEINEPYTTKLLRIRRNATGILLHNKATQDETEPAEQD